MKREDRFRLLAAMALADGELHATEHERLLGLARLIGLRPQMAEDLIKQVQGTKLTKLQVPARRIERYGLFQDLVLIAAQDGEIAPGERRLLDKLAPHFGIGQEELDRLLESSLQAMRGGEQNAPVPETEDAEGLSPLLREVLALKHGEERLRLVARLARVEGWEGEGDHPAWLRCGERLRVEPDRVPVILAEEDEVADPEDPLLAPLPLNEVRDGLRCFSVLVGLNRLRDLVEGEVELLACVARRFGVAEVLLRRKLYLFVPGARPQ
ncbi:MAG: TerB family tellurite resistance protein [Planctomycetota bacterium]